MNKNDAPDKATDKGTCCLGPLPMSGVNPVSYRPVPLHCTVSCEEDLWSLSLWNTQTHTDCNLSGLAAKQLSEIVAPGAGAVWKLRKWFVISLAITEGWVLILQLVVLIPALVLGWWDDHIVPRSQTQIIVNVRNCYNHKLFTIINCLQRLEETSTWLDRVFIPRKYKYFSCIFFNTTLFLSLSLFSSSGDGHVWSVSEIWTIVNTRAAFSRRLIDSSTSSLTPHSVALSHHLRVSEGRKSQRDQKPRRHTLPSQTPPVPHLTLTSPRGREQQPPWCCHRDKEMNCECLDVNVCRLIIHANKNRHVDEQTFVLV